MELSPVIVAQAHGDGRQFDAHSVDVTALGRFASSVLMFDEGHVRGRPFSPNPRPGLAAVSYLFEDAQGDLRARDSLGNDVVTGPRGMVWTQAGSGNVHEELAAEPDGWR